MQRERNLAGISGLRGPLLGALALLLAASAARAEEPAAPPPSVSLDQLLSVPRDVGVSDPRRGGATRTEWRARFDEARAEKAQAEAKLAQAREELSEIAGEKDSWQMSAPGLGGASSGASDGPLSYKLRQEMRRQKAEIARADRRLQELKVEANLAGVPPEWIEPE